MPRSTAGDLISRDALQELIAMERAPSVSIYFPTQRAVVEPEENSLKLKDALRRAHDELRETGMRNPDVDSFLEPLTDLLDRRAFWQHQTDGAAFFRTADAGSSFKLPFPVDDQVIVGPGFHVKPLLPALSTAGFFYILALSQKQVRLLRASRHGISEEDLSHIDMPTSLAEALRYDDLERADLQSHPGGRAGGRRGSGGVFHGREGSEDHKEQILRFFQGVSKGLNQILRDQHAPLILAGVEYLRPLYRQATDYRYVVPEGIDGNPDGLRPEELLNKAKPIIDAHYEAAVEEARDQFGNAAGTGLASSDLTDVVLSALDGRVASMFASRNRDVWGTADNQQRVVQTHERRTAESVDLTDLAARATLANRGHVYLVDEEHMPDGGALAAVYRY